CASATEAAPVRSGHVSSGGTRLARRDANEDRLRPPSSVRLEHARPQPTPGYKASDAPGGGRARTHGTPGSAARLRDAARPCRGVLTSCRVARPGALPAFGDQRRLGGQHRLGYVRGFLTGVDERFDHRARDVVAELNRRALHEVGARTFERTTDPT